jgi:hypothetical protein
MSLARCRVQRSLIGRARAPERTPVGSQHRIFDRSARQGLHRPLFGTFQISTFGRSKTAMPPRSTSSFLK